MGIEKMYKVSKVVVYVYGVFSTLFITYFSYWAEGWSHSSFSESSLERTTRVLAPAFFNIVLVLVAAWSLHKEALFCQIYMATFILTMMFLFPVGTVAALFVGYSQYVWYNNRKIR